METFARYMFETKLIDRVVMQCHEYLFWFYALTGQDRVSNCLNVGMRFCESFYVQVLFVTYTPVSCSMYYILDIRWLLFFYEIPFSMDMFSINGF